MGMNKAQFLLLLKAWADTRNIELMALIEDILENLFETDLKITDIFTEEFKITVRKMNKEKSELGGKEAVLVAGFDDEQNTIMIWESIGKAARETDGNQGKISNCVKDGTKHLKKKWIKVLK
jgi:hypothetical protein